jgi:large subunit ribosomal protein L15
MDLHNIQKSSGRTRKKIRIGRWNASGKGNYSTKGLKGQKARSWYSAKASFEGWQTPLFMRLPKRKGFKRYFKLWNVIQPINVGRLNKDENIADGSTINKELLVKLNYLHKDSEMVKVLWTGDLAKKLTFVGIEQFSGSARTKIEAAGGSITE